MTSRVSSRNPFFADMDDGNGLTTIRERERRLSRRYPHNLLGGLGGGNVNGEKPLGVPSASQARDSAEQNRLVVS